MSTLFRQDPYIVGRVQDYHSLYGVLHFSAVTRYEFLRGLYTIPGQAQDQIRRFNALCRRSHVISLTAQAAREAADVWAHFQDQQGSIGAGDILIAGTARAGNRAVATRNVKDYRRVPGLLVSDWREP